MAHLEQENVVLICLNTRNFILDVRTCYIGTVNSSCLKPGEVLRHVIQCNAPAFMIAHNHPSGDPSPSQADFDVTKVLHAASKLLDVDMLDHLIIGRTTHYSMAQSGGMPSP
jgi:DNA repair protein RadC